MNEVLSQTSERRQKSVLVRGSVAVVLSVLVNAVLVVGLDTLDIAPGFDALTLPPVTFLSAVGAVGATVVYWALSRYVTDVDRVFVRVAGVVLVLSFIPDIALLELDPAATVPGVVALMVMHLTVAVASVWALVYWGSEQ